jgi:aminopeptidase YwaD
MKRTLLFISSCIILIFFGCSPTVREFISNEITTQELQHHIKYLASDELRGRKAGEEGNRLAAKYIADKFKMYGLLPCGNDGTYYQNFSFVSTMKAGPKNNLSLLYNGKQTNYTLNEQFKPLLISADTTLTGHVVFAGYGISAADSLHYNDYASIDIKNKIVMIMRYSPDTSEYSQFAQYSSTMAKLFTARDKGAAGVILVTAPPNEKGDNFITSDDPRLGSSSIAVVSMKWIDAQSILNKMGMNLIEIKHLIDSTKSPKSIDLPSITITLQTQIEKIYAQSANVLGYLSGSDSILKNEVLVIGAHFDHLGMGGEGSGSLNPDTIAIHHGADDNASGTAGILELAQYLSSQSPKFKRSLLFIAFTGEELGVLGSDYYVKHPYFTLDKTIAMLNMDMIGRMKDSILVVEGMGTSPDFEKLVKSENKDSLTLRLKPDGFGPSDQASFYKKDLPVMFFFTNLHSDYHKPSDTWEKINYAGEQKVVEMAARIAEDIANDAKRPAFTKVITSNPMGQSGDRQGARVSLGIIPDFAGDTPGMKISGTRPGSPAEKAGLKADDVIIKFGGKEIKNIYDFTYMLGQFKPGDEVEVVVNRANQEVVLKAKLQAKQ